tara:strand:- start:952 stop:1239 length:288 start_codon:yes stop_codon:yes gene_type:complete
MNIVEEIIYPSLADAREELGIETNDTPETVLFGCDAYLDSIGLVNLIVSIEELIEERSGKIVTLATEKAMSRSKSPFKTVQSLTDYIQELLEEKK